MVNWFPLVVWVITFLGVIGCGCNCIAVSRVIRVTFRHWWLGPWVGGWGTGRRRTGLTHSLGQTGVLDWLDIGLGQGLFPILGPEPGPDTRGTPGDPGGTAPPFLSLWGTLLDLLGPFWAF